MFSLTACFAIFAVLPDRIHNGCSSVPLPLSFVVPPNHLATASHSHARLSEASYLEPDLDSHGNYGADWEGLGDEKDRQNAAGAREQTPLTVLTNSAVSKNSARVHIQCQGPQGRSL